jgi:hypothetical protein
MLLVVTAVYLWQFSVLVSSIYIGLYIVSVIIHGYVCAFSRCPYKGTLCPGAFAYFPVGKVALLYDKLGVKKSDGLIGFIFVLLMIFLLGIMTLPLYWISILGIGFAIGYVVFILAYFIVFLLTICPKCAMRNNCPAARLSNSLYKTLNTDEIL